MGAPGHAVCVCDAGAPVSDTSFPVFEGHLTSEAVRCGFLYSANMV